MRFLILFASLILLAGCTTTETPEPQPQPTMTCEEYCPTQPHVQCVGQWSISGNYPDCNCEFVCDQEEVSELLDDGLLKSRVQFFSENDGSFETTEYKWLRSNAPDAGPGDISFDNVAITDVKFDGDTISSIRGAGLIVFDEGSMSEVRGVIIFLDKTTPLDGRETFDIEYFPSVDHRYMEICSVQSKDLSMDMEDNWISKYFIKCEDTSSS